MVTAGTRLGPYEIVSPIGAGGMGEVYRARDSRLDRDVAIKILPAHLSSDAQFRERFEREARAISQLNHPHICVLHDVGNENGTSYLVMELLEGESLADRLAKGPLPVEGTLRYGVQIAQALDRAHRQGIIHRDLKPGNIMITKSGAKLLDFGLAKSASDVPRTSAFDAATEHKPLTAEGTIIGTFQYMAPEQLEGSNADARTDIFALGTVLYEMATGRRAFDGKTKTSLIAAIVDREPTPISQIQPLTPQAFEHVVQKCLSKDPDDRWQSVHDIAEELRWIAESGSKVAVSPLSMKRKSRERLLWITALVLALGAAAWMFAKARRQVDPSLALSITAPPGDVTWFGHSSLSPDGNAVVFSAYSEGSGANTMLWLRSVIDPKPKPLAQTEGGAHPFWSPDGKNIGFFAGGKLKRISASGGPARVICGVTIGYGGSWNQNGVILFASDYFGPILRVSAEGGKPEAITKIVEKEEAHRWPFFLPDGDHFIFLGDSPFTEYHNIKVGSLRDGSVKTLTQAVSSAAYAEPGVLLYVRGGSLLAHPFDTKSLHLTGEARVVADQITLTSDNHYYEFSASNNGRLLYRSANVDSQLTWVDRSGKELGTVFQPRRIETFRIAPDGRRIVFGQLDADGRGEDLWLVDPARNVATRLTLDPASDLNALPSPAGDKFAFLSLRDGVGDVYLADIANPANVRRLTTYGGFPQSWTPDGQSLVIAKDKPHDEDMWLLSVQTGEAKPYLETPYMEVEASFSPDGQWIAYQSDESGKPQVYMEQFPTHADRRQISTSDGYRPFWSADGRELLFMSGRYLMSFDRTSETTTRLFRLPGMSYFPAADGKRILIDRPVDEWQRMPLTLVTSWTAIPK